MSTDTPIFVARSCHVIASDRIYRVQLCNDALYFLRVGGQFNVDRGNPAAGAAYLPAAGILAAGELLFRKHAREEMLARDTNIGPEELLSIHPHNFKLTLDVIASAVFLRPRWYAALREHYGRLVVTLNGGQVWQFEFERRDELCRAMPVLAAFLEGKAETEIVWDARRRKFRKTPRQPLAIALQHNPVR